MPTDTNPAGRQIRRAQNTGARNVQTMLSASVRDLRALHEQALADIQRDLADLADSEGRIPLDRLGQAESIARARLRDMGRQRDGLLEDRLGRTVAVGVAPWGVAADVGIDRQQLAAQVLEFVTGFVDDNGLQLSDRLWRVDRLARDRVTEALERAIVQGHSAAQAARDLLLRGESVPDDLLTKRGLAALARIQQETGEALMTGTMNPFFQAERVMRTEINRAYGETAIQAAIQHPDVIGLRFNLSPLHPEVDICDFHAEANLHGLGPGIYPINDHPWPAHPNTLSFMTPVFRDEITDQDRAGRQSMTDYLNQQAADKQDAILGGQAKGWAWRAGHLSPRQIRTPWKTVRPQLQRRGIDIPERFAP